MSRVGYTYRFASDDATTAPADYLRFLLDQAGVSRDDWHTHLASWAQCDVARARDLLAGERPSLAEVERIAAAAGVTTEEVLHGRVADHIDVLPANLEYLLSALPRGGQKQLAEQLGVSEVTVSRWRSGDQRPSGTNLAGIRNCLQLGRGTDLAVDPLFLREEPATYLQRREWLHAAIERLDDETLTDLFPALTRLLGEQ